ncbi:hypothetical protein ACXZ88_12555 [Streptococcus agalactiae]
MVKRRDDEILYTGRLSLFGVIPLWKVKYTKREWQRIALMGSKRNKIVECQFIDDEEKEEHG